MRTNTENEAAGCAGAFRGHLQLAARGKRAAEQHRQALDRVDFFPRQAQAPAVSPGLN